MESNLEVFDLEVMTLRGSFAFFLRVARASDKNVNFFHIIHFSQGTTFVL